MPPPPSAHSRNQMQQTDYFPRIGAAVNGLVEDLKSISIRIVPGSSDLDLMLKPYQDYLKIM